MSFVWMLAGDLLIWLYLFLNAGHNNGQNIVAEVNAFLHEGNRHQ